MLFYAYFKIIGHVDPNCPPPLPSGMTTFMDGPLTCSDWFKHHVLITYCTLHVFILHGLQLSALNKGVKYWLCYEGLNSHKSTGFRCYFFVAFFFGGGSCVLVRCQSLQPLNRNIEIGPMIESVVFFINMLFCAAVLPVKCISLFEFIQIGHL